MDQDDRIYTSKVISIQHYDGKIINSNHGNGTQPNKNFKEQWSSQWPASYSSFIYGLPVGNQNLIRFSNNIPVIIEVSLYEGILQ